MKKEFKASSESIYGMLLVGITGIICIAFILRNLDINNTMFAILIIGAMLPPAGIIVRALILFKRRIILDHEKIISTGLLRSDELYISQVMGYRSREKKIFIIPKNTENKKIEIGASYKNYEELKQWVEKSFTDLDNEEINEEGLAHRINPVLGKPEEGIMGNQNTVRNITRGLNAVSVIAGIAAYFVMSTTSPLVNTPLLLKILIAICLVMPLIGLFVYRSSKGLISLEYSRKSGRPSLMLTFSVPVILIMPIFYGDELNIVSYMNILIPASIVLFVMAILYYVCVRSSRADIERTTSGTLFFTVLSFAAFYAFGSVTATNWVFNTSAPVEYQAKVLEKTEPDNSSEGSSHYYLTLSEWGPFNESTIAKTPFHLFRAKKPGDTVKLQLYKGLHDIPYYKIIE